MLVEDAVYRTYIVRVCVKCYGVNLTLISSTGLWNQSWCIAANVFSE